MMLSTACDIYFWKVRPNAIQRRAGIAYILQSTNPYGPRYFIRRRDIRFTPWYEKGS